MRLLSLALFIFCSVIQIKAQQTDFSQKKIKYDYDSLGLDPNFLLKTNTVLSIDINGIVVENMKSNYYYKKKGQFWQILKIKNPDLGFLSYNLLSLPVTIQPYYIEKKMLGDYYRQNFFTDDFDPRIASIITQKIQRHLIENIGFNKLVDNDVLVLDESYFKSRLYFLNMDRTNALYLLFASELLQKPTDTTDNINIKLIYGLAENRNKEEYLHIELIFYKDKERLFKTAINVFQDWSNINLDEFSTNDFLLNEIIESLFQEIFTE
jgi:hypothetical protein